MIIGDPQTSYVSKCDVCGKIMDGSGSEGHSWGCNCESCNSRRHEYEVERSWELLFVTDLGQKRNPNYGLPHDFPDDICRECAIKLTPYVQRFAECWLINVINNRLQRAIYEQRKKLG